jgi:hypothetical protein
MSDIEKRRSNIFEVLDELIFHLNTTKSMFTFLIVTSFILAPLALIVAAVITLHPGFLALLMRRLPSIGLMIIIFIGITVILASVWLYIGLMERSFFSEWNKRFSRFISLKERIDRELEDRISGNNRDEDREGKHDGE